MAPLYTASSTNNTFYLSTDMLGWAHAEADCNLMGGHLASYSSRQEQVSGGSCCAAGWDIALVLAMHAPLQHKSLS